MNTLFPIHADLPTKITYVDPKDIPPFTADELKLACKSMPNGKAPGADGMPAEILKMVEKCRPDMLLDMYNSCLIEGTFPKIWKIQRLVLVPKAKHTQDFASKYRPLCMLNTAGKLLERLLKIRLTTAINAADGLSNHQHGSL